MKAVVWHGKEDVRVDNVPDPIIQEPTDAVVRITSTAICGSDLHLYSKLSPLMREGDIIGHEPMGIVEEVGRDVEHISPGDRVVVPFNVSCGHCYFCDQDLYSQCETTRDTGKLAQGREPTRAGQGREPLRLHARLRRRTRRAGRVPARAAGPLRPHQRSRKIRRTSGSSTSRTCCRRAGRPSRTRISQRAGPSASGVSAR